MTEFTIIAHNLELPYGTRHTYKPTLPLETGALYLLTIGDLLTVGRYYRDIDGFDWIIQPSKIIHVDSGITVEIWGLIVPLKDPVPGLAQFPLLAAGIAIIEICNLAMPLMT